MDQHILVLIVSVTSIMLLAYWFNYCMGTPLADDPRKVDVGAIFFFIPLKLADRRLKKIGIWREYKQRLLDEWDVVRDKVMRQNLYKDHVRDRYNAGRAFFTWERSLLCPVCFHWWLTVIFTVFYANFTSFPSSDLQIVAVTYLVNHFFIRKI